MDILDKIIAYEQGEMEDDEIVSFAQELLDTGIVYSLQGSYQRLVQNLIDSGYVIPRKRR